RHMGTNGITALMIIGDLPAHPGLDKLDFLVQCNMFKTGTSEYADVLLPVTDFLENEGHVLSMDGRLKKVNRAVARPGDVKSMAGIVSGLANAMEESGFSQKPAEIFRELKPEMERPAVERPAVERPAIDSPAIETPHEGKRGSPGISYPVSMMLRYNHFRYRGNRLNDLVPDLESVTGQGTLGLSDSLMVKLRVKEGDTVRIITEHGEMDSVVRSNPGQNCQTACLFPNGSDLYGIQDGVYPDKLVVNVKIEKV
ncbi:MAG: molybdopterin-dependent oxidoreductase, partial [Bacteroidales bacterium]|nr:molybdopterin-dependent oxidoreductase [Bacteroidales bacterium]